MNLSANSVNTFTAPGTCLLAASTSYFVVVERVDTTGTTTIAVTTTTSSSEDATPATGWSISNDSESQMSGQTNWANSATSKYQIRITGEEAPENQDATGQPEIRASAEGSPYLFAETVGIRDGNGLPFRNRAPVDSNIGTGAGADIVFVYTYQWIRVDGMIETNVGTDSEVYHLADADYGKLIKVDVSFTDQHGYSETVTSEPFRPVRGTAGSSLTTVTLVGNTGQSNTADATITEQYAQGFTLGGHGQGYELSSVSIELAAVPSALTVSLWIADHADKSSILESKLYDFKNPGSFAVGANEFTAPPGALLHQNIQYAIVLSGFTSLSIKETTSDAEDAGGEPGAQLKDKARVRDLTESGRWGLTRERGASSAADRETGTDPNIETPVLRLAIKGSKRASGILASTYGQAASGDQEITSLGDDCCMRVDVGAADRYLIRGVSWNADDTTSLGGGVTNPYELRDGSATGDKLFGLFITRNIAGAPEWSAPQGATVAGGSDNTYFFSIDFDAFDHIGDGTRRGHVLTRVHGTQSNLYDRPFAPGMRFSEGGDVIIPQFLAAVLGEPLYAMVQNLGQTDATFVTAGGSLSSVVAQGFTTGPNAAGYELQGIGINIEGSDDSNSIAQVPDDAASVSVAVYRAAADGKPDTKLFDLVSPTEYAPGHSFFEAPPGTTLAANTSYVVVWRHLAGTAHRLQLTLGNSEDSGALSGFSIADVVYKGGNVSVNADSAGNALEIAVYTNRDLSPPKRVSGFDLDSDNSDARGIWGNDDTIWVANDGTGATDKLYAYNRSDGSRDSSSDFDNLDTAGNNNPRGICSDGTTMFVADNDAPQGLSCDRTHIWVAQDNNDLTSKIFVYLRSDESHASTLDIGASTLSPSSTVGAINNNDQRGMWSNGTTLFVVDHGDSQVYGYKLSDRSRDDDKNLTLDAANANAWGLWFDGRVLWVVDDADDKLYVYDLPGAQPENTPASGAPTVTGAPVLSATLTVKDLGSNFLGCDSDETNKGCEPGELLTDNTFSYDSVDYEIRSIDLIGGQLSFETNKGNIPAAAIRDLTLNVGALSFPFADATHTAGVLKWSSTGLSWSEDDMIALVISIPAPTQGDTLSADASAIGDATDGLAYVYYHYQWIRDDGTDVTELDGETGATYTTTADDVGKNIQVRVVFDDHIGYREYPRYSPQVTVQEVPPEVTSVTLTSDPGGDDTYAIEDSVTATVTFDKAVDVTSGPQITLLVGTADKAADCAAATNTTTMECSYEVVEGDAASSGVGIKANTLVLNSGTIYSTGSTTNSATLTHSALALQSGHEVDGIRPTLVTTGNNSSQDIRRRHEGDPDVQRGHRQRRPNVYRHLSQRQHRRSDQRRQYLRTHSRTHADYGPDRPDHEPHNGSSGQCRLRHRRQPQRRPCRDHRPEPGERSAVSPHGTERRTGAG